MIGIKYSTHNLGGEGRAILLTSCFVVSDKNACLSICYTLTPRQWPVFDIYPEKIDN